MKRTKKAVLAAAACITVLTAAFGFTACANGNGSDGGNETPHSHVWSGWTVSQQPTADGVGKATRTCTGEGDCDAATAANFSATKTAQPK